MTLVVADTGPIRYLVIIGAVEILRELYDRLLIPTAVWNELTHPKAPHAVRNWASTTPSWVEVKTPASVEFASTLDRGEAEAIALAIEVNATALLLDEADGRKIALERGLPVAGTIGILEKADERGLLDLRAALAKLSETNFRIDAALIRDALERARARRNQ